MEAKILNFNTISQGKIDVYFYENGMYPTKGTIMGFMGFNDITYADTMTVLVYTYTSNTFHMVKFDVIELNDNNTDYLEVKYNNKRPTFITTSKLTLMDFMRKEILTSPHTWTGKLNIQSNMQRKNVASELYHELVKLIKKL